MNSKRRRDLRLRGGIYEDAVIEGLIQRGFKLITRNYYVHQRGELDAVMERGQNIYIIEVKARKIREDYPDPIESIGPLKIKRIKSCLPYLLSDYGLFGRNIHFLAGCVNLNDDGSIQNVQIIPFE